MTFDLPTAFLTPPVHGNAVMQSTNIPQLLVSPTDTTTAATMVHETENHQSPVSDSEDLTISNGSFGATSEKVEAPNEKSEIPPQELENAAPVVPAPPRTGPPPPPNGGLVAWLHVVGGFMLFFNTWGILNAFGVFQTYYEGGQLFTASSSDISWIGSIQSFMVLLGGVFAGPKSLPV